MFYIVDGLVHAINAIDITQTKFYFSVKEDPKNLKLHSNKKKPMNYQISTISAIECMYNIKI